MGCVWSSSGIGSTTCGCSVHPPTLVKACEAFTSSELNECGEPAMNGLKRNGEAVESELAELKVSPKPCPCVSSSGDSVVVPRTGDGTWSEALNDPWCSLLFLAAIGEVAVVE
jgi:hypothetical protein